MKRMVPPTFSECGLLHHGQRVGVVVHVRAALERRETSVADTHKVLDGHARQRRRLVRPQVGARDAQFCGLVLTRTRTR